MNYNNMHDKNILSKQYKDSEKLDIRKVFHKNYSTNSIEYDNWILSNIHIFKGCRILELGCGTGNLWENNRDLIDSFSELVLSDISQGMLKSAKERYADKKNITYQIIDIHDIPHLEESFDIIIANSMLYHVPDINQALKSIHRVLSQNGTFYATTFSNNEGLINYINTSLCEIGLSETNKTPDISFSLENGDEILNTRFSSVKKELYDDHLEVTAAEDIIKYIYSMSSMSHLDTSKSMNMLSYFESQKNNMGIIKIPKLYGMFISSK